MNEKPMGIAKYPAGTNWHEINQRITNSEDKIKMLEALLKESNGDEFIYLKGGQKFTNQEQKLKELYTSSEIEEELNERTRALIDKYKQRIEELEAKCEKLKKKKHKGSGENMFAESEISHLQSRIHKIVGDGEIMQEFNKLLGINAG